MNIKYTDKELIPLFKLIYQGKTVDEASVLVGFCPKRFNTTLVDIEVRSHIVELSSRGRAERANA